MHLQSSVHLHQQVLWEQHMALTKPPSPTPNNNSLNQHSRTNGSQSWIWINPERKRKTPIRVHYYQSQEAEKKKPVSFFLWLDFCRHCWSGSCSDGREDHQEFASRDPEIGRRWAIWTDHITWFASWIGDSAIDKWYRRIDEEYAARHVFDRRANWQDLRTHDGWNIAGWSLEYSSPVAWSSYDGECYDDHFNRWQEKPERKNSQSRVNEVQIYITFISRQNDSQILYSDPVRYQSDKSASEK